MFSTSWIHPPTLLRLDSILSQDPLPYTKNTIISHPEVVVYGFDRYIGWEPNLCLDENGAILPPSPVQTKTQNPFGNPDQKTRTTVSLGSLLVSMVVFAAISLLLMFAARVPAIANSINDLLGISRSATEGKPDRSTHLFMLLFCYSSPLMLMLWVSLFKGLMRRRLATPRPRNSDTEPDPLA
jgi:hypothetical protein